jgi:hypothetical protein
MSSQNKFQKNLDLKKIEEFNSLNTKMKKFYKNKKRIINESLAFNLTCFDRKSLENSFLEVCQLNKKRCQLYEKYWEEKSNKNLLSEELNFIGEEIQKTQENFYQLSRHYIKENFQTSLCKN